MNPNNTIEENQVLKDEFDEAATVQESKAEQHLEHEQGAGEASHDIDEVQALLQELGVSESIAASARVIVHALKDGTASSESIVKLIVQALRHDEDLKNAETQGYLRGRNEVIEAATHRATDLSSKPVNFPIYSKRSFWDF